MTIGGEMMLVLENNEKQRKPKRLNASSNRIAIELQSDYNRNADAEWRWEVRGWKRGGISLPSWIGNAVERKRFESVENTEAAGRKDLRTRDANGEWTAKEEREVEMGKVTLKGEGRPNVYTDQYFTRRREKKGTQNDGDREGGSLRCEELKYQIRSLWWWCLKRFTRLQNIF